MTGPDPSSLPDLGGRWAILGKLGAGGEGAVYRVRDTTDVLRGEYAAKIGPYQAAARELERLFDFHHTNLSTYRDAGTLPVSWSSVLGIPHVPDTTQQLLWFIADIALGSLNDTLALDADLRARRPMPVPDVVDLLRGVLEGLAYMHGRSFVHGDLKPGNILRFAGNGAAQWRLADFGQTADQTGRTSSTLKAFSHGWMPPEALVALRLAPSADVYAAGQVAHVAVTGSLLVPGSPPVPLPAPLDVVHRMVSLDPAQRPTAADALVLVGSSSSDRPTDKARHATGRRTRAAPTQLSGPTTVRDDALPPARVGAEQRDSRRGRAVLAGAAVLALVAAVVAAVLLQGSPTGDELDSAQPDRQQPPASNTTTGATSAEPEDGAEPATGSDDPAPMSGYLAYSSRGSGTAKVSVTDLASREARTIETPAGALSPSVSADGQVVVYLADTADGPRLGVFSDGRERVIDVGARLDHPAVSPDGTAVVYAVQGQAQDVRVRSLSGTSAQVLAGGSSDEIDPAWSSDGTLVVFVRRGSSSDQVVVVDATSGDVRATVDAPGGARSPSLSPDGQNVAFVTDVAGNGEVVVVALTGGEPENVSLSPEQETGAIFLSNGCLATASPDRGLLVLDPADGSSYELTGTAGDSL